MIALMILAEGRVNRLQGIRRGFTDSGESIPGFTRGIMVMIGIAVLVLAIYWVSWRIKHRCDPNLSPLNFFAAAIHRCRFGRMDRFLLLLVARSSHLPEPASMLLAADLYRSEVDRWSSAHGMRYVKQWGARRLQALSPSLFNKAVW